MELTVRSSHCQFREPNRSTVRRHDTSSAIASGSARAPAASRRITSSRTNPVAAFRAAPAFDDRPGTFVLLPLGATVRLRIALSATSGRIVRPGSVARGCARRSRVRGDVRRRPRTCPQRSIPARPPSPTVGSIAKNCHYLQLFTRSHLDRVAGGTAGSSARIVTRAGIRGCRGRSGSDRGSVERPVTRSPVRRAGAAARRSGCRADSREGPA